MRRQNKQGTLHGDRKEDELPDLNIFQGNFLIKHKFLAVIISSVSKNLYENKIFNSITSFKYTNSQVQPNLSSTNFLPSPFPVK